MADITPEQLTKAVDGMEIVVDLLKPSVPGEWVGATIRYPGSFASAIFARVADRPLDEPERCPDCHMPLTMHHDPMCSQPCGRCQERKAADPELTAVARILAELDGLEGGDDSVLRSSAVQRVLTYVLDRHGYAIAGADE